MHGTQLDERVPPPRNHPLIVVGIGVVLGFLFARALRR
jgi:hypothetical protein